MRCNWGGAGINGVIPNLTAGEAASLLQRGFATYGSDSGHQFAPNEWTLSDEALKNLGYMQMKKTHDAAMVLIERTYGERPRYNYFVGTSQGRTRSVDRSATRPTTTVLRPMYRSSVSLPSCLRPSGSASRKSRRPTG
jgi:hypothetical protein